MIDRVISGGQTGADQAGWRAAKRFGIATGGWMPRGFLTESGPRPGFAELYGAVAHESCEYPPRTRQNVADSDVTLWFGSTQSAGYRCTCKAADEAGKLLLTANGVASRSLAWAIKSTGDKIINIAGNRESKSPGIGAAVEAYLVEMFKAMGFAEIDS